MAATDAFQLTNQDELDLLNRVRWKYTVPVVDVSQQRLASAGQNLVYKTILPDGRPVVVKSTSIKKLDFGSPIHEAVVALRLNELDSPYFARIRGFAIQKLELDIPGYYLHKAALMYDYIPGGRLEDFLPRCTYPEMTFVLYQLLYALYTAHKHFGFVHYDLYFKNIVLNGLRPVIIDFETSRIEYGGRVYSIGSFVPDHAEPRWVEDVYTLLMQFLRYYLPQASIKAQHHYIKTQRLQIIEDMGQNFRKYKYKEAQRQAILNGQLHVSDLTPSELQLIQTYQEHWELLAWQEQRVAVPKISSEAIHILQTLLLFFDSKLVADDPYLDIGPSKEIAKHPYDFDAFMELAEAILQPSV